MNSLIILPTECVDPTIGILRGARAEYAFDTHGIRAGQEIKVAILGESKGTGKVRAASRELIEIEITRVDSAPSIVAVDLIVGVSRPQTVKKVIQAATILGARSLHFVKSEQGEKSYLQSTALEEEHVQFEVIKGLEQVWEPIPPKISVHRNLGFYLENHLNPGGGGVSGESVTRFQFIAHPGGLPLTELIDSTSSWRNQTPISIAIGPERGWSAQEVLDFQARGFRQIGLGERVMRVELALVFLFGQLQALKFI